MSLSDMLAARLENTFDDDQGKWRQFILDHLNYIAARSKEYDVDADAMNLYRYDLGRFLKDKLDRRSEMAWIVLLLNNLHSDFEFTQARSFIVPSDTLIETLYHSYTSIASNAF